MSLPSASGEVLRGMHVEVQPLRVGRTGLRATLAPSAAAAQDEEGPRVLDAERRAARAEGEQSGYAEGLRRGLADAAVQAQAALEQTLGAARLAQQAQAERMDALFAVLEGARCDLLRLAEDDIVALCYETVCRIVGDTALEPAAVRHRVQIIAATWAGRPQAVLHLHPQDAALLGRGECAHGLQCVADPDVLLGGCIVRCPGEGLDARLETALAACRDTLLAVRTRHGDGEQVA